MPNSKGSMIPTKTWKVLEVSLGKVLECHRYFLLSDNNVFRSARSRSRSMARGVSSASAVNDSDYVWVCVHSYRSVCHLYCVILKIGSTSQMMTWKASKACPGHSSLFAPWFVLIPFKYSTAPRPRPRPAFKGKTSKAVSHGQDDSWVIFIPLTSFYETPDDRINISSEDDAKSVVSTKSAKRWDVLLWQWCIACSW